MKTNQTTPWTIDGRIDLTAICVAADWHQATMIEGLIAAGLDRHDAESFASFAGHDYCNLNGGRADGRAEDHLTDEQWARLS